jgi:hypothetical protein
MNFQEIAQRNRANRMGQLERLRPVLQQSKQAQKILREAQDGAGDIRKGMEVMERFKHVPNFFPTPQKLVERMIDEACLDARHLVLEPSAGKGNIAVAVRKLGAQVRCIERLFNLAEYLRDIGLDCECRDFLETVPEPKYDRILMNPPFERGIDRDHIEHAVKFLNAGGRLVAICTNTTGARLEGFSVEPLEERTFAMSERPTNVRTCLVIYDK